MKEWLPEDNCLKNKVVLITGAGSGIGQAVAINYAKYGANVILAGKMIKNLEKTYQTIVEHQYPDPIIVPLDLAKIGPEQIDALVSSIHETYGKLDGIVHNAALFHGLSPIEHFDLERWYETLQINLNAPFMLTQALLPLLKKSSDASIIFTLDKQDKAYWGAYGVSKTAVESFAKILHDELDENTGIHVHCINPGPTRTFLRATAFPAEHPLDNPSANDKTNAFVYCMSEQGKTVPSLTVSIE